MNYFEHYFGILTAATTPLELAYMASKEIKYAIIMQRGVACFKGIIDALESICSERNWDIDEVINDG